MWTNQAIRLHGQRSGSCCCCGLESEIFFSFTFLFKRKCSSGWAWRGGGGECGAPELHHLSAYNCLTHALLSQSRVVSQTRPKKKRKKKKVQSNNECLTRLINQGWWEALRTDGRRRRGLAEGHQREETNAKVLRSRSQCYRHLKKGTRRQMKHGPMLNQI